MLTGLLWALGPALSVAAIVVVHRRVERWMGWRR